MKALYTIGILAASLWGAAVPLGSAYAANYLSSGYNGGGANAYSANYLTSYNGGGFSGSNKLTSYGAGGYSPGGGLTLVNYGYNSGATTPDAPHRYTWASYTRLRNQYNAERYNRPLCGAYHSRTANYCGQATTRWTPASNR